MGSFLTWLWTLPLNVAGWLFAHLAGTDEPKSAGCFLPGVYQRVARPGGFCARYFSRLGFVGLTIGDWIFFASDGAREHRSLVEHEHQHVRQMRRLGPLFPFLYYGTSLLLLARGGGWRKAYLDNPFEREAREVARASGDDR